MIRGLKKKLLIGLLSATVVGTSLAPSVPLVGSFAQEVKADDSELPEGMYKYTLEHISAEKDEESTTYEWDKTPKENKKYVTKSTETTYKDFDVGAAKGLTAEVYEVDEGTTLEDLNNGTEAGDPINLTSVVKNQGYKWPTNKTWSDYYTKDNAGKYTPLTQAPETPATAEGIDLYKKEVDTTKSTVTLKPSTDTDKNAEVKSASIDGNQVTSEGAESQTASAVIERNKDTNVTLKLQATTGNTIKSVVAEIIDSATKKSLGKVTATKVDGATDTYEFVIKATTAAVDVLINAQTEKLMITPKLNTTNLSPKVGTAALTSTDAVDTTGEFELKVTLEKGVTVANSGLKVETKNLEKIDGDEKNGVVIYKIPTEGVTDKELEIKVSGRLENDGLDKTADDKKGSTAEVKPTDKVAADANEVLEVAKSDLEDNQYVKAVLTIAEVVGNEIDKALQTQIDARTNADENIESAGVIKIDLARYVADNPGALVNAVPNENVTNLGALLTVHYVLPDKAQGKTDYKVISIHDSLREITTTPNEDGEYLEISGNSLILHVKKLSQFAILYNTADATTPEPEPIVPDDDKKDEDKKDQNQSFQMMTKKMRTK
ncbi:hypothetical protein, partial [Lachnobacterium bovis]|uniref:hypothetical protein n=1 Tax=Lachnobacterium bovis TaxID=140626 RepID=UPI00052409F6